jgi:PKD repeat protein
MPPTFVLGVPGNIDVTITGNPTRTSTIKVDFGDQSAAVTMSAVSSAVFPHAYSKLGTFTVNVTVTMPDGSVVTKTADVSVLP